MQIPVRLLSVFLLIFPVPQPIVKVLEREMTELLARPQAPWALRLVPPFPAVAQRILALASQEDVSVWKVFELVKMDPSFSAELLRFANSALFAARREVTSLPHAIMLVGMDRVKTMATFVAVNRMVRACSTSLPATCLSVVSVVSICAGLYTSSSWGRVSDRKSTRLNSSHLGISYAVFC